MIDNLMQQASELLYLYTAMLCKCKTCIIDAAHSERSPQLPGRLWSTPHNHSYFINHTPMTRSLLHSATKYNCFNH